MKVSLLGDSELKEMQSNEIFSIDEQKRGFILSFCSSMGVSGTALHQCPETACCGAIFKQKCGFFSGSPLATPGHQRAVPMGPAPALVPSAGRDAGTPLLGWQRNMLPSIFLLKAGNKEG